MSSRSSVFVLHGNKTLLHDSCGIFLMLHHNTKPVIMVVSRGKTQRGHHSGGCLTAAAFKFSACLFVCKQDGLVFLETQTREAIVQ